MDKGVLGRTRMAVSLCIPPSVEMGVRWTRGRVEWILHGGKGLSYDVEQSSDLRVWTPWRSVRNPDGRMTLTDDATDPIRAYRAIER